MEHFDDERDIFINSVKQNVRFEAVANEICRELEDHIEDKIEDLISDGMSYGEAVHSSVISMGGAEELGRKINNVYKLQIPVGLLVILGTILFGNLFFTYGQIQYFESEEMLREIFWRVFCIAIIVPGIYYSYPIIVKYRKAISIILFVCQVLTACVIRLVISGVIIVCHEIYMIPILLLLLSIPVVASEMYDILNDYKKQKFFFIFSYYLLALCFLPLKSNYPFYIIYQIIFIIVFWVMLYVTYLRSTGHVKKESLGLLFLCIFVGGIWFVQHWNVNDMVTLTKLNMQEKLFVITEWGGTTISISMDELLPQYVYKNYRIVFWILKYGWITCFCIAGIIICLCLKFLALVYEIKNLFGSLLASSCVWCLCLQMLFYVMGNFGYQIGEFCVMPFISEGIVGGISNAVLVSVIISTYRYDKVAIFLR